MSTAAEVVVLPNKEGPLEVHELTLTDQIPHQVVIRQVASAIDEATDALDRGEILGRSIIVLEGAK